MRTLAGIIVLAATATAVLPQTDPERIEKAAMHFRVAQVALANGDLKVATSALKMALDLDPNNGLIHYNLAVVQRAEDPEAAQASLARAKALGLPDAVKEGVKSLEAQITYAVLKLGRARYTLSLPAGWALKARGSVSRVLRGADYEYRIEELNVSWNSEGGTNAAKGARSVQLSSLDLAAFSSGRELAIQTSVVDGLVSQERPLLIRDVVFRLPQQVADGAQFVGFRLMTAPDRDGRRLLYPVDPNLK